MAWPVTHHVSKSYIIFRRPGVVAVDLVQSIFDLEDDEDEANPAHDIIRYEHDARGPWDHARMSISYALPGEAKLPTLIPNRYWQLFNDPGFSPSAINPGPSVVMVEAFLGLTHQVQAMVGIMQANIPHIPQLVQQTMPLEPITQPAPQQ
ncbi:hypothetical protein BHE74_00049841 [Ensete ventricosum]|nr:hypothetical protein GW17_00050140 [Ensete ventricosum]RWW44393.1 hypothetical protein BHE74_00049841 [Ensete ventricosum]